MKTKNQYSEALTAEEHILTHTFGPRTNDLSFIICIVA